jgi:hypothetical protein
MAVRVADGDGLRVESLAHSGIDYARLEIEAPSDAGRVHHQRQAAAFQVAEDDPGLFGPPTPHGIDGPPHDLHRAFAQYMHRHRFPSGYETL